MENNKVLTVTLIVAGFLIGILSLMIYFRKDLIRMGGKLKDYLMGDVEEEKVEEKPPQGRYDPVLIQKLSNSIEEYRNMTSQQVDKKTEIVNTMITSCGNAQIVLVSCEKQAKEISKTIDDIFN